MQTNHTIFHKWKFSKFGKQSIQWKCFSLHFLAISSQNISTHFCHFLANLCTTLRFIRKISWILASLINLTSDYKIFPNFAFFAKRWTMLHFCTKSVLFWQKLQNMHFFTKSWKKFTKKWRLLRKNHAHETFFIILTNFNQFDCTNIFLLSTGYFWHISDIHYNPKYLSHGKSENSESLTEKNCFRMSF